MKKIFLLASTLLLALSATSCMKELENPQKGTLDLDTYYATAGDAETEQLVAGAYNALFGILDVGTSNTLDIIGGDCTNGGGTWADNANAYRDAQELILTTNSWPFAGSRRGARMYDKMYQVIYECNLIIEKVTADTPAIKRYKAEAKFIRALTLFEAIRWWGTPPFADHIYGEDDMYAENGNQKEMIDWILANLDEASKELPALPGKGRQAEVGGRATASAATAYYGKVALWYATTANDAAYATKAVTALKSVVNSGLYDLLPNINDVLHVAADWSPEYVFERNAAETSLDKNRQADNRHTWRGLRVDRLYMPKAVSSGCWGYCLPSKNFVEFMLAHDGADNARFKSKIMSYETLLAMEYEDDTKKGVVPGTFLPDCVGYFNVPGLMLYSELYDGTGNSFWSKANWPLMRYADVLLMYAEAQFVANGDSDKTGLAALNKVRVRAQLAPLGSMTYQDIKDERRAELWTERDWFFDLRRWGDASKYLKDAGKVRYEFYGYKEGTTEYDIREVKGAGSGWNDRYNLFPYSQEQLTANPNLKQNPGWD